MVFFEWFIAVLVYLAISDFGNSLSLLSSPLNSIYKKFKDICGKLRMLAREEAFYLREEAF